ALPGRADPRGAPGGPSRRRSGRPAAGRPFGTRGRTRRRPRGGPIGVARRRSASFDQGRPALHARGARGRAQLERPHVAGAALDLAAAGTRVHDELELTGCHVRDLPVDAVDRKSTRLNSSHVKISYAVFCLKKKQPEYPSITWHNLS